MATIYLDKVTYTNVKTVEISRSDIKDLEKIIGRPLPEQEYLELTESEIDNIISYFKPQGPEFLGYVYFFEKMKSVQLEDNQELKISIW